MSDTPTQTTGGVYRRLADTHGVSIADVARLDQIVDSPAILDAACATLARGATVEHIIAILREQGMDKASQAQRLGQLRELNG